MAIVEMQKLSLAADKKNRKAILETLQAMGVMHVENEHLNDPELQKMDTRTSIATFERNAATLEDALRLLRQYGPKKKGGSLFKETRQISRDEFTDIIKNQQKFMRIAGNIVAFEKQISESKGTIQKDEDRITSLTPWLDLDIPMNFPGTRKTCVLIGTVNEALTEAQLYASASKDMEDPAPVEVTVLKADAGVTYLSVLCLKKDEEQVENNLRAIGFARPAQIESGVPSKLIDGLREDILAKEKDILDCKEKIASYSEEADEFEIAADYYRTRAEKYRLLGTIPQTENVFFLEGFVTKDNADDVASILEEKYGAMVQKEDLREDELEPTLLKNNGFADSAEGVLEAYGLPRHGHADPTAVMSVFYVIFFGMMLSDAGYGIVMAIACGLVLWKKKNIGESLRRSVKLFFFCGISTTFWGFMYGSFFGDAIDVIAKTFFGYPADGAAILQPLWLEPLANPMRLLVWCMLFGLIHLYAGLGVKGYEYLKNKDMAGFIGDVVSWYLFVTGLTLILVPSDIFSSIAGTAYSFPAWVNLTAKILTVVGAVIILLMSGRDKKNWAIRIALGAYGLYGISGWLSDVLSYSRLLALGLATGVIASVINSMASMFGGGVGGAIAFILVFLLGHTVNIGINALGAYVHANRLQYVEFFGKFYEAGGRPFKPFKTISKYVKIKEEKVS